MTWLNEPVFHLFASESPGSHNRAFYELKKSRNHDSSDFLSNKQFQAVMNENRTEKQRPQPREKQRCMYRIGIWIIHQSAVGTLLDNKIFQLFHNSLLERARTGHMNEGHSSIQPEVDIHRWLFQQNVCQSDMTFQEGNRQWCCLRIWTSV